MKQTKTAYDELYPPTFTAEDYTREETYRYTRAPVEAALTLIPEAYTSYKTDLGMDRIEYPFNSLIRCYMGIGHFPVWIIGNIQVR